MPSELRDELCQLDEGPSDAWTPEACNRYAHYYCTRVRPGVRQQLSNIICRVGGVCTLLVSLILSGSPAELEAVISSWTTLLYGMHAGG